MAYTDDAVVAKLSALNETQESIVTVAQWVMFHRRHADRTGQIWLQRLKDSGSSKRLNLIYLANEVAQQSKARKKNDFLIAFSPVIAEAAATAYRGATNEVQQKLRRVIEVWRERHVFEIPIQEAIEQRIDELDKNRATGGKGLGGSLFTKSAGLIPMELNPLVAPQQTISKVALSTKASVSTANTDYEKLTDTSIAPPSAPVHAARLNGLLKALATAEGAVAESIKARKLLIEGLGKLLEANTTALNEEEGQLTELQERRVAIDTKKRDVEDSIMRGLVPPSEPTHSPGGEHGGLHPANSKDEPNRPEVEALTPPSQSREPSFEPEGPEISSGLDTAPSSVPAVADILKQLRGSGGSGASPIENMDQVAESATPYGNHNGSAKKRKFNDDSNDAAGLTMDDIDDDVLAMIEGDTWS